MKPQITDFDTKIWLKPRNFRGPPPPARVRSLASGPIRLGRLGNPNVKARRKLLPLDFCSHVTTRKIQI